MLRGPRLLLRAVTTDDTEAIFALRSDPAIHLLTSNVPYVPRPKEVVRRHIEKGIDRQVEGEGEGGDVCLVAEALADGAFVGEVFLWGVNTMNRFGHLGLTVAPEQRGQGYATEIVEMMCHYAFGVRGMRRLELETFSGNAGMRAVATRCGFAQEGIQRGREYDGKDFEDVVLYGLLKDEWER
jgi:RimJ/RimL family protein N-acetyltransferase